MTEHEKIIKTIEKHKSLFDKADCDVAITAKGTYFFYYYSKNYDDYYNFIRFQTAKELEQIIMENVSADFCMAVEGIAENLAQVFKPINPAYRNTDDSDEDDSLSSDQKELLVIFSAINEALSFAYEEIHPYEQWIGERIAKLNLKKE